MDSRRFFSFVLLVLAVLAPYSTYSQHMGTAVSTFLDFPVSAHTASLGGNNVSYIGNDHNFAFANPSLLKLEDANKIALNYSVYMAHTGYGSASYTTAFSDKDAFMVGFQGAFYGSIDAYDAVGNPIGKASANDFALSVTYSRYINKYFSVGVTLKPVINSYGSYTSFSLGSDVGVTFHDSVSLVNLALVVRNFGGRLAGPADAVLAPEWMPLNVSVGLTKRLKKAPLAFHLTLQNLQSWDSKDIGVGSMIGKKFAIGMDIIPKSERFWIGVSYNFDRGLTLANPTVLSVSGLSFGGGARLYMMQIGVGVGFYSTAAVTAQFSLAMDINWFSGDKKL